MFNSQFIVSIILLAGIGLLFGGAYLALGLGGVLMLFGFIVLLTLFLVVMTGLW